MNKLRKVRDAAKRQAPQVPLHPYFAGVNDDTPFWRDLPDILQAQLLVMLDNGLPTKRNPTPRPAEKLQWAGTPYLRLRTKILLFCLWMVLLLVPTLLLVELVDEIGPWVALGWSLVSVFVFVPRISRGSREAFALTTRRCVVSKRSMYCSIQTYQVCVRERGFAPLFFVAAHAHTLTPRALFRALSDCVHRRRHRRAPHAPRRLGHVHLHQDDAAVFAKAARRLRPREGRQGVRGDARERAAAGGGRGGRLCGGRARRLERQRERVVK